MRRSVFAIVVLLILWIGIGAFLCEGALRVRTWEPVARANRTVTVSAPIQAHEEVSIQAADGAEMHGAFVWVPGSRKCVIVLHGIADSRAASLGFADLFLRSGYSVLAPDLRGHGTSGGDLVTYGIAEKHDVLAWARKIQNAGCEQVFGFGESLGGAILIQAAAERPDAFAAIASECSYSDFRSVAEDRVVQRLPGPEAVKRAIARSLVANGLLYARVRYGLDLDLASPVTAARNNQTPLLLIHGLDDPLTPPEHSRRIAAASQKAELWLVPDAGHTTASAAASDFGARIIQFFDSAARR